MGPYEILKTNFGYESFRGEQKAIIDHVLSGSHALVLMPTGMGKSLCYQIPAKLQQGLTLVISPLIALMKDQADKAVLSGIRCCEINSAIGRDLRERRYLGLSRGEYELVYVAPERFKKQAFLEAIQKQKVTLLALDEAHCISQWGHDFRPDYSRIAEFREVLGNPTTLALTATATPEVQSDIIKQMGLNPDEVKVFNSGIKRENLNLETIPCYQFDEKVRTVVALRHQYPGAAIVYSSLISTLEKLSAELERLSLNHVIYHGQLPPKLRKNAQDEFMSGNVDLILATPAFGLGIDKADIRTIIHFEIPSSLEAYYQEAGRAGRDGQPSQCFLLYDHDDVYIQMDFIKWANPDPTFLRSLWNLLERNLQKVNSMGLDFLREQLNFKNRRDFRLETGLNLLERWGAIEGSVQKRDLRIIGGFPDILADKSFAEKKLQSSNQKLLGMVQYAELEGDRLPFIYNYFGVP